MRRRSPACRAGALLTKRLPRKQPSLLSCRLLLSPGSGDVKMESSQGNAPCDKTFCRRVRSLARSLDGSNWSLRSDLHRRLPRYEGGPVAAEARRRSKCKVQNGECSEGFVTRAVTPFCIWNGAPGWDLARGLILRRDTLYTLSYGSRENGAGTGIRIRIKTLATSRAAAYTTPAENWRPRLDSHQQPAP